MTEFIPYPFYHDDVPIDISFMFEDEKPAGKHGFLKVDGRDFVFEDGTKVKFWGTNFNGWGCFPEHDYAEILAKRLSKIGLNLVRFHQLDAEWHTPNIFAFTKGKKMTGATLDPESMDRLDYLIYCLKKEGIYCYMDMLTYRRFRAEEGVENAKALGDSAKPVNYFDETLIDLQKKLCKDLWTHENPYTDLRYCDDPIFVLAEVCNESDLFSFHFKFPFPEPYNTKILALFDKWLKENGYDKTSADFDFKNDSENETIVDFKIYIQEKYYEEMFSYMREIGIKIPLNGTNHSIVPANVKTQLCADYIDTHPYYYTWGCWEEFRKCCENKSVTQANETYLLTGAYMSAENKPTYISEWDVPWPNEYRADGVLYTAALGLLQGWNGYAIHTYSYSARLERMDILGREIYSEKIGGTPYRQGIFSTWNDPAKFGLFYHAAIMTRRGDVKKANEFKTYSHISKTKFNDADLANAIERHGVYSEYSFDKFAEDKPVKVDGNILSDTGELFISREKNYGYIDTDGTKCAYGFLAKNGTIDLSGVKVTAETDFAVIAMSSLTDEKITESSNILLTTVGRAQNTGAKFVGDQMIEYGEAPVLIESIKAEIEIETPISTYEVWGISPEGFYIGMVPTKYENGKLTISLGSESRSMYYLILKN